jgi:DNA-directed RNA polymerase specialized sigma24 family protein
MPAGYTNSGVSLELIRSVRSGDLVAFADLVCQRGRRIMGTVGRMMARPEDVEDVTQEVFFRMYTSIGKWQQPKPSTSGPTG